MSIIGINMNIREARENKKIKQKDLSELLNISKTTLCRIERGSLRLPKDRVNKVIEILNITEKEIEDSFTGVKKVNFRENKVYINLKKFDEQQKEKVLRILEIISFCKTESQMINGIKMYTSRL